jgi:hypothetical protein
MFEKGSLVGIAICGGNSSFCNSWGVIGLGNILGAAFKGAVTPGLV